MYQQQELSKELWLSIDIHTTGSLCLHFGRRSGLIINVSRFCAVATVRFVVGLWRFLVGCRVILLRLGLRLGVGLLGLYTCGQEGRAVLIAVELEEVGFPEFDELIRY